MVTDNRIAKEDVNDLDFVDAEELASDGYFIYRDSVPLATTANSGSVVTITAANQYDYIINTDFPVQVGDRVFISGSPEADGYYIVSTIIDEVSFSVNGAIANSAGGVIDFMHPAGATKVGVDSSHLSYSNSNNLQNVLQDLDGYVVPIPQQTGEILFAIEPGKFRRAMPVTSDQGWLVNEQGIMVVVPADE